MPECIIVVGVPGSGKTTLCKERFPTTPRVSSDDHFMKSGEYVFVPAEIGEAHFNCFDKFVGIVDEGVSDIVVDNTNTTAWELAPYFRYAEYKGYTVKIIRLLCDPVAAHARNVHGVPLELVQAMDKRVRSVKDNLAPWWPVEDIEVDI